MSLPSSLAAFHRKTVANASELKGHQATGQPEPGIAFVIAKDSTQGRPARWRNYGDLSPAEKTAVRRRYSAGESIMRIAQRFRVYAGTIVTAAERGRWARRGAKKTVGRRIATSLERHPRWSDSEIAESVGCDQSYVHTVRGRMRTGSGSSKKF